MIQTCKQIESNVPYLDRCITTSKFKKLTKETFDEISKQVISVMKNDTGDYVKKISFDEKLKKINNK